MERSRDERTIPPQTDSDPALRQRAEAMVREGAEQIARSPEEGARLLHELRVHQIELEMQNEELRRAQEELEIARARYFALYDLAPISYFTLSAQGIIQEANLTAVSALGVPREAMIRHPLAQFVLPDDQEIYYRYRKRLATAGGPHVCELRMLRADQSVFWARLETTIPPEERGEAVGQRTVISDVSARVRAEQAVRDLNATLEHRVAERTDDLRASEEHLRSTNSDLERALRLKDEFLAMMSHELRTPLSIVLSIAEALSEEIYGPLTAAQRQALATLAQSGHHLLALLSDILDLSRIAVGRETLDLQPVSVSLVCQIAVQFIESSAQAKQITLRQTVAPGLVELRADDRRLTQILVNLLSNAVKFTPEGGQVDLEVSADAARQHIQFSVWDSGIGIAPADQERIFEPFVQADTRLARQYGGSGLGLALVRRLVALHGGDIRLESALGQGSRFTVSLPWSADEHTALAVTDMPEAVSPAWATPPLVLIADDDEPSLALNAELLARSGCRVITARTGEDAVAQAIARRPDVAVRGQGTATDLGWQIFSEGCEHLADLSDQGECWRCGSIINITESVCKRQKRFKLHE
ncbi:PAS domain S-box protein [Oscillochloris sp. ZM17-4]|nr:ATP-binding protein [Oscillochloris sp. ZM17-4]MBX0327348.1 PAS domain S-box protein [Oscillochloris sp. ZM17-4]